jgi:valyl-tRNA synthetase
MLVLADWPEPDWPADAQAEAEMGWVVDLVSAVRSVRSEMNIAPSTLIPVALIGASSETQLRALKWSDVIQRLARTSGLIGLMNSVPPGSVQLVVRGEMVALPLTGVIDFAAERARLEKELAKIGADIDKIDKKLGNADFIARAPEEVVDEQRDRREEAEDRATKLRAALERLKGAA